MTLLVPASTDRALDPGPLAGHTEDRAILYQPVNGAAPRAGKRPLAIYCHGAGNTAYTSRSSGVSYIIGHLCNMGFVVLAPDLGDPTVASGPTSAGSSWGNATLTARIEAWRVWAAANLTNVYATKLTLFGASMGGANSLAYARDYTANTAAVVNVISFCDMAWARSHRADGSWTGNSLIAPLIDSAWGITSGDPTPADCDLLTSAKIVGVPWRSYTRADDPLADPSRPPLMATHIGASALSTSVGNGLRTVTDGTTTNGSNVVGSVTGAPNAALDVGKPISGGTIPASSLVTGVNLSGKWLVGDPITGPKNATATASSVSLTIGQGHDETAWFQVDIDAMFSWLLPYALN